jgi:uncharacterized protein YndB with AHSA1/START domain
MRILFLSIFLLIVSLASAQTNPIPKWYSENNSRLQGIWIAGNSSYYSKDEPYINYAIELKYGLGKSNLVGRLYGITKEKQEIDFWQFRLYWNNQKQSAELVQYGYNNLIGIGELRALTSNKTESIQQFSAPDGRTWKEKHITKYTENRQITTSYDLENNLWNEKRTYNWHKQTSDDEEKAISKIDTLASNELMLTQEILINANVGKLWKAYSTPEEWKKWVTPVVEMDFRINGTIKSHYDSTASIGDKGTIVTHILNYIPYQLITMQAELNENFPAFMKGEEKNLYSIVKLEELSAEKTKLTIYGIGYNNEQQWRDLLKFFIQGNEMTLNKLKKHLEK